MKHATSCQTGRAASAGSDPEKQRADPHAVGPRRRPRVRTSSPPMESYGTCSAKKKNYTNTRGPAEKHATKNWRRAKHKKANQSENERKRYAPKRTKKLRRKSKKILKMRAGERGEGWTLKNTKKSEPTPAIDGRNQRQLQRSVPPKMKKSPPIIAIKKSIESERA